MDYREMQKEATRIRSDIGTAHTLILDTLSRYKKKKLGARSKKLAEDMTLLFSDLEIYENKVDIQNAYGYASITEKEYYRLLDLWEKREQFVDKSGKFADRVTEMLTALLPQIGAEYLDFLEEAQGLKNENDRNIREVGVANQKAAYERYINGLK